MSRRLDILGNVLGQWTFAGPSFSREGYFLSVMT